MMKPMFEPDIEAPLFDGEPIPIGCETAEEAALTTNIYREIRSRLAARGVPPEQVAFIHDAKTPAERAALFKAVNDGKVRVLIGSTEKMGTGMNAQERLAAIHQITPPWRPGDLEQQAGRMIRQGNLYPEVFQFVHLTSGSFDAYTWQLLENKAGFIAQIASGEVSAREVDDLAENVLTFSEIKALASGNPRIMEKVLADAELARLEAVRSAWRSAQHAAKISLSSLSARLCVRQQDAAVFAEAIRLRDAHPTEKFSILLKRSLESDDFVAIAERDQAGKRIRVLGAFAHEELQEIGRYRGFALVASIARAPTGFAPQVYLQVGDRRLAISIGESDIGITLSLDAKLRSFEPELQKAQEEIEVLGRKLASLEAEIDRPWEHEERYTLLKAKAAELEKELNLSERGAGTSAALPTAAAAVDTSEEVLAALEAIRALHADPAVLARFGGEEPQAVDIASLEQAAQQAQAQLEFAQAILAAIPAGETVQLGLFGDFIAVAPRKRRR